VIREEMCLTKVDRRRAPPNHSASNVSGLNFPVLVMSLTSDQTRSGVASIWTVTAPCMDRVTERARVWARPETPRRVGYLLVWMSYQPRRCPRGRKWWPRSYPA
jgi:hypothetical protein